MNTLLATVAVLSLAGPGSVMNIDDDGVYSEPAAPTVGYTVDIDDDGWTRVEMQDRSNRGLPGGECSQLELSVGVNGAECGTMDRMDLTRMKFEAEAD